MRSGQPNDVVLYELETEPGERYEINLAGTHSFRRKLQLPEESLLSRNIEVRATAIDDVGRKRTHWTIAHGDGSYELTGLLPGEYTLSIAPIAPLRVPLAVPFGQPDVDPFTYLEFESQEPIAIEGENQSVDAGTCSLVRSRRQ